MGRGRLFSPTGLGYLNAERMVAFLPAGEMALMVFLSLSYLSYSEDLEGSNNMFCLNSTAEKGRMIRWNFQMPASDTW